MIGDKCDYCEEPVRSPYMFAFDGKWYSGHKRCCAALQFKLQGIKDGTYTEQVKLNFEEGEK